MKHRRNERGMILIIAMLVVFALAAMVLTLSHEMSIEARASSNQAATVQAAAVEQGAEQYVLAICSDPSNDPMAMTEDQFDGIPVGDGFFWIMRPAYDGDPNLPPFGLVDEASKIDINDGSNDNRLYTVLLGLSPNVSDAIADSIIDWRDANETPRANGAESSYYGSLPDPYRAKDTNFETIEELRLVSGMTKDLLWGDGSGVLGQQSTSIGSTSSSYTDANTSEGLADFVTVWGAVTPPTPPATVGNVRVNVNTASPQVLYALFLGMGESQGQAEQDAQALVGARSWPPTQGNTRWIAGTLGAQKFGTIQNYITGTTSRYVSADILAVAPNGRAFQRVRIVVDRGGAAATAPTPKIIYRRDLSDHGWPMDPSILDAVKAGQFTGNQLDDTQEGTP